VRIQHGYVDNRQVDGLTVAPGFQGRGAICGGEDFETGLLQRRGNIE
jgi:hypothetical protein